MITQLSTEDLNELAALHHAAKNHEIVIDIEPDRNATHGSNTEEEMDHAHN